jgi:hypothetical protein
LSAQLKMIVNSMYSLSCQAHAKETCRCWTPLPIRNMAISLGIPIGDLCSTLMFSSDRGYETVELLLRLGAGILESLFLPKEGILRMGFWRETTANEARITSPGSIGN